MKHYLVTASKTGIIVRACALDQVTAYAMQRKAIKAGWVTKVTPLS